MRRASWLTVLLLLPLAWTAAAAAATRRVALVIGEASYAAVETLANPVHDADAIAGLLLQSGFDTVILRTNIDGPALRRALSDFEVAAAGADIALVYFSGHGLEAGGQNYIVPTDARLAREVDIDDEAIPLTRVLRAVEGASRLKLVIVDACRNDPFKKQMSMTVATRGISRGLARVEPEEDNLLVAFAAKAGAVADDGQEGSHSPYTAALLDHLAQPGRDIRFALGDVRDEVVRTTHGRQTPYYGGSLGGEELPLVEKREGRPGLGEGSRSKAVAVARIDPNGMLFDPKPAIPVVPRPPTSGPAPIVARERAALLVAAPDEPGKVKTYVGSVVWSLDFPGAGSSRTLFPEVRAQVEMPEAKLGFVMTLAKNTDPSFAASATFTLRFSPEADYALGDVKQINIPQMRKHDAQTGDALTGVPVTITVNQFIAGLQRGNTVEASNLSLIRSREWFDIPLMLASGKIAKVTFEKGASGQQVIEQALEAWDAAPSASAKP